MSVPSVPLQLPVSDRSQIGEARRRAADLALAVGLGPVAREHVALIVNELASNLVKHAGGGELIARTLPERHGVEVLSIDRGTGMANVEACFHDGYSTTSSAGTGLGAVRRLASFVDVYSARPGGTVLVARVLSDDGARSACPWSFGGVCVPMPGQEVCGDGWAAAGRADDCSLVVADGLGHGLGAADASRAALACFSANPTLGPSAQIAAMHLALRGTRGAAVAVVSVDRRLNTAVFSGVGNIAGQIVSPAGSRQLVSLNGTAGHAVHKINEFTYPWSADAVLLVHSDGLTGRWDLDRYPGLITRDPSVVAAVLFRDHSRGRDDVTVVAARGIAP